MITPKLVAEKLSAYLCHKIDIADLVDWAEKVMMENEFEQRHYETLQEIVSRLGVADVRAFGLTWEDCERFLNKLGYAVRVEVVENSAV